MPQNERVEALSPEVAEKYCEVLVHQILDAGVEYDFVIVILGGAHWVWSYLREIVPFKRKYEVWATHYRENELHPSGEVVYRDFPTELAGHGLVVDDCTDSADALCGTRERCYQIGATQVDTGVVLCKRDNIRVIDPRTGLKFWPTFVGWENAPGNIFFDFPREAFKKRIIAARLARASQVQVAV